MIKRRLSIVHIYQSPSDSGAEGYAREMAMAQSRMHEVRFVAKAGAPLEKKMRDASIATHTDFKNIDFTKTDVVVMHSTQELRKHWPRLLWAKLRSNLKVVVYSHIWISHSKRDPIHAIPYAVADRIWCSSYAAKLVFEKFLPVRKEKIEVVRYGRNLKQLNADFLSRTEARKEFGIPDDAIVVGTMGRVDKGKGSLELFEAVTDVMQSRQDLWFLMIGPPTPTDPKAIALDRELTLAIDKLNPAIRSRVRKVGGLPNGPRYLKAFDLFVLATYKENFALTLLEAMYAEIPCLATESGGSPDMVRPHATGWLFLPESTESLRTTLLRALDEREKWNDFARHSRELVSNGYDFDRVIQDVDAKLCQLAPSSV